MDKNSKYQNPKGIINNDFGAIVEDIDLDDQSCYNRYTLIVARNEGSKNRIYGFGNEWDYIIKNGKFENTSHLFGYTMRLKYEVSANGYLPRFTLTLIDNSTNSVEFASASLKDVFQEFYDFNKDYLSIDHYRLHHYKYIKLFEGLNGEVLHKVDIDTFKKIHESISKYREQYLQVKNMPYTNISEHKQEILDDIETSYNLAMNMYFKLTIKDEEKK